MSRTIKSNKRHHTSTAGCGRDCEYCQSNRTHKNDKRVAAAAQDEKEAKDD